MLHEEDYTLGMNKGLFDGTREYEQYILYEGLRCGMRRIKDMCGDNYAIYNAITGKAVYPIKEKYDEMKERLSHEQRMTDEELLEFLRGLIIKETQEDTKGMKQ